ncbi:histidine kinase N-terminal 7TM domain-containing protein [Armatimonas sp.]|uniref:histidine kinase N-terminal 7TM domain-containing protein n=1 Tax=Armatimonas sp. TaxID=1872638 RepID=UPI00374D1E6F
MRWMNSVLAEVLYALCSLVLAGASIFLLVREGRSPVVRWFVASCLALLVWVVTLFLFGRSEDPGYVLLVGRANFAAVSLAVYFGFRFVKAVAALPSRPSDTWLLWLSVALAVISATTPWIDKAELVGTGITGGHETVYGPLFALYVAHVVGMLAATLWLAFRSSSWVASPHRDQLLLLGWGTLATGVISLVTNALLPYTFDDFRWIDVGPLSTLLFLLSVAYAVIRHQLFDIRVFIRRAVVLGVALSMVLACYSALVLLVTDTFASSESGGVTRFGVLVLAFSFDPIRRFLEGRIDKLLFHERRRVTSR